LFLSCAASFFVAVSLIKVSSKVDSILQSVEQSTNNLSFVSSPVLPLPSGVVSASSVPSPVPVAPAPSPEPLQTVIRGSMSFHRAGRQEWVNFNGSPFYLGSPSEFGLVAEIKAPFSVTCLSSNGDSTILIPQTSTL